MKRDKSRLLIVVLTILGILSIELIITIWLRTQGIISGLDRILVTK